MRVPYYLLASALCLAVTIGACSDGPTSVSDETANIGTLDKKEGVNVDLCHRTHYTDDDTNNGFFEEGDTAYVWISVDPRAEDKHKDQHGDGDRAGSPADTVASSPTLCDRDDDVDGIADDADNCPETPNNDQVDTDADGSGDACDLCEGFDDSADADEDGVPDGCDNCVDDANAGQEDIDDDGIGDACDACTDVDGDGYCLEDDDCDDSDPAVNPGATEVCDDLVDNDCNGDVDEADAACAI